jgi:2-polyprenyl-3-methyl-5-hydroxy-6-metoxy-1,4-benzoquinol methylase
MKSKYYPYYKDYLKSPIIDLGCGRGDTVECLRNAGEDADGIDKKDSMNDMAVGDISDPVDFIEEYNTAMCIDVFEHLSDPELVGVLKNMQRVDQQIITVRKTDKKTYKQWESLIMKHLIIVSSVKVNKDVKLYKCIKK